MTHKDKQLKMQEPFLVWTLSEF